MKGVFLFWAMFHDVDKKNSFFFFHFVIDNYDLFVCTWSMKTNKNIQILGHRMPSF
jgi:hypothetical protein